MARLILIIGLLVVAGCKPGYFVYGDSLTSPYYSWANQVSTHYLQVNAVPGLRLREFELPAWIKPTPDLKGVLLFLGANDAGSGVPVAEFYAKLERVVAQANAQGLPVVCVAVPVWPNLNHFDGGPYRDAQAALCGTIITLDVSVDVMADTPDGLHWGAGGHELIARQIEAALEAIDDRENDHGQ